MRNTQSLLLCEVRLKANTERDFGKVTMGPSLPVSEDGTS